MLRRLLPALRDAARLAPARPAYAAGLRAAIATVAPLAASIALGNAAAGTWASLGGFNGALSDRGGAYRTRLASMAGTTAAGALAAAVGALGASRPLLGIALTFAVALAASLLRVYGVMGAGIGLPALSAFVVSLAFPADDGTWQERVIYVLAGGAWAMLLSLVVWPLRPYRPARIAVAGCFEALATYVDEVAAALVADGPTRREPPAGSAAARAALEHARAVLAQQRRGRPGTTARGEQLLVLSEVADQLFGHVVAIAETVAATPAASRDRAADAVLAAILHDLAAHARALSDTIATERGEPSNDATWSGPALRAALAGAADPHYAETALLLDRTAQITRTASATAAALNGVAPRHDDTPEGGPVAGPLGAAEAAADVEEREDERWPARAAGALRAILTPDSLVLRYALRVAVTTSAAAALAHALGIARGYWVMLTVIVILQPYTGETTRRAWQRVLGTVVGGLLTAALGAMFHDLGAVLVLSFLFAGTCVALLPVNYAAFSVFLTPTFVLLAEASAGDWHLANVRIVNTLIGGALAVVASRLLWPSPERTRLRGYLAAHLRASRDYLRAVIALFPDRSARASEAIRAARRQAGLAAVNAEESFQRFLGEHPGESETTAAAMTIITFTRRLGASLAALALARHSTTVAPEVLSRFEQMTVDAIEEIARAVDEGRAPPPLPPVGAATASDGALPELVRARFDRVARQLRTVHDAAARLRL